jgi:putative transposase
MKTRKPHQRKGILVSSAIIYPSDLGDDEWELLAPLIPPAKPGGRPRSVDIRRILGGIFYLLRSGCPWRLLPHDLPNWSTAYWYFRKSETRWDLGTGQRREAHGKFVFAWDAIPNQARLFWIVNRSKPVPCVAMSVATMGGKKIQGRKRHLLVDTQGLLLGVKVLAADIRDRAGGMVLLTALVGRLPRLQVIWGDSGYAGDPFEQWVKHHLGVRLEIVKHPWTGLRGGFRERRHGGGLGHDHAPRVSCPTQAVGGGAYQRLDHAPPSPLSRC